MKRNLHLQESLRMEIVPRVAVKKKSILIKFWFGLESHQDLFWKQMSAVTGY